MGRALPTARTVDPAVPCRPGEGRRGSEVHIDLDHSRIADAGKEGLRPFDDHGRPTPYLESIMAGLDELDQGHRSSADFFAALERYELLEPFSFDVELARWIEPPPGRLPFDRRGEASRARTRRDRRASLGRLFDADLHGAGVSLEPGGVGCAKEQEARPMADAAPSAAEPLARVAEEKLSAAELDARLKSAEAPFVVRGLVAGWPLVKAGLESAAAARAYLLDHRRERAFTVNIGEPGARRPPVLRRSDGHEFPHRPRRSARDLRRDRRQ